jgi:hypothetical protein
MFFILQNKMERYLVFKQKNDKCVEIFDKNDEYLGSLEKIRVGAWMSWCLTSVPSPDIYFSASCQDEIREKTKELNAKK